MQSKGILFLSVLSEKGRIDMPQIFGYVRVSARDQNAQRQLIALEPYKIPGKNLYLDQASGKNFDRPAYQRLLKRIREGDLVYVKSIDRLGRNYDEIIEQWRYITKDKKADIMVIDMPLLDTRRGKDLIGTLISDIVLQLLSYVAQTEREFIHQRQAEGIAAARMRGKKFGRPRVSMPEELWRLKEEWEAGRISARQAARCIGVSHITFLNGVHEQNAQIQEIGK